MTDITIGIDISKATLDVCRVPGGDTRQFTNDKPGLTALLRWISAQGPVPARIVFEATGAYHRLLERGLAKAHLPVVKVNPRQARRFAQAIGRLAKTDRLDAALLARMGECLALEPRPVHSVALSDLKELLICRQALVKDRTAARNRAKTLTLALPKRQNTERLKQIDRQLAAIDDEIEARITAEPDLAARHEILLSIPGIAEITAATLVIEMPELGTLDQSEAASLSGLAPQTRQSGQWTGRAFVHGGRAQIRQALYMPAVVATRFNPDLKAKYDQLVAAGKPKKVAITVVMRKLIVLANALLRARRKWTSKLA